MKNTGEIPLRPPRPIAQRKARRLSHFSIGYILAILFVICLAGLFLYGCAPKYGMPDPDRKQALRTLAGGVAGALIVGNTGGAIVGAFVADVVSVTTIKYEDWQLENGEQAARRYREQEQKAEERREQERKAEEKKEEEKKAGNIKEKERKAEEQKEQEKRAGQRKPEDKRVKLIIENSAVETHAVRTGEEVRADIRYALFTPDGTDNVKITETRRLWTAHSTVELDTRDITRTQGTYRTAVQFKMPDGIPKGYCILYTTISVGRQVKTAQSVMNIL